ncbi:MAG: hypothetical protein M3179_13880 [Actinomycetota bacterium]|nr:hypothetical protein [Actinomycetota bacterium]
MAVALQIEWDGFTPQQYDDLRRKLDWDNNPPDGALFHAAWFENDSLHVFDVWDSREDFQRFLEQQVIPNLEGGMPTARPRLDFRPLHATINDQATRLRRSIQ